MTLVRKGIIRWKYHAIGYTVCLLLSLYGIWLQVAAGHRLVFWSLCAVACGARIQLGVNKYELWCAFTFLLCFFNVNVVKENTLL
jgi:hypothetical protein